MRVGFDCDGVLYDFTDGFRRSIPEDRRGVEATRWGFFEDWGIPLEEFSTLAKKGVEDGVLFWTGTPLPGAAEVVNSIREAGHEVYILTHRGIFGEGEKLAREATEHWLSINGITFDELILVEDKASVKTEIMIDDKPENFHHLFNSGVDAYLMHQAWNSHIETDKRINVLTEFRDIVLSKESTLVV